MRFVHFWVTLCCLSVAVLRMSVSITVKFPQKEPLHVKLGQTLVLEAQIQLQQNERIELRTWELRNSNGEVRVAEGDKTYNNRTSIEKNGALLRIKGVVNSDYGIYKVTVTSNNGDQVSDSRQVLKITNPPNASLSMHCSVPTQGARWDNPSFLWQVDGIKVTNETGEISEDGSSLRLVNLGHSYTCISMSSQGESQVQVLTIGSGNRSLWAWLRRSQLPFTAPVTVFLATGVCLSSVSARMDVGSWCLTASILLQAFVLPTCLCVSVRFPSQQTVYVVSGQNLVLQAEFELPPGDQVTKVTWQHEVEGKRDAGKTITTVAEYPARSAGGRVTVDKGGSVITLGNYQRADNGVYTVTVWDQKGGQSSARCTVHEYDAVHHVSIMVNVSHSSLHCMEAWGTEPVFRWLHEKVAVTEAVGRVSADGTSLYLNTALCGHFTCMVSNKLGHSSATYTAVPCEREGRGTAVAIVCLMLLLLLAGGLAFLVWRKRISYSNRGERLREPDEDM